MNPAIGSAMKRLKITEPWFDEDERTAVMDVLASGQLVQAGRVAEFEQRFAAEARVQHAVMVSSGTAALHLTMLALGIGPGDAVAIPDFTFVATANAVALTGATPLFVDVRPDTYNMDVSSLRRLVEPMKGRKNGGGLRLKAIMPVHQFGLPAEMNLLAEIAKEHSLYLIEDAACALGSRYQDRAVGTWGLAACFSFHPRKVITTGEGGAVVTNDRQLADRIRALRAHGFAPQDGSSVLIAKGLNYRMTEIQAALGLSQLRKLPEILQRRRTLAESLHQHLEGIDWFARPSVPLRVSPNWQSYAGVLGPGVNRTQVIEGLAARGVEARTPATAIHLLGAYQSSSQPSSRDCPVAEMLDARALALPLHPLMDEADVKRVATALRGINPA